MPISRERAVDLARRVADRLARTPDVETLPNAEQLRSRILHAFLEWERESEQISAEVRRKLLARPRAPAEGTRAWDLLYGEELARAYQELVAHGE